MSAAVHLPVAVSSAIQKLNDAGFEAYAVGGCVRDSLLGRKPDDWDITTSALPQDMQSVFAEYRTIETGLKHGTLTVLMNGVPLEITSYRVDGAYSDGRHPDTVCFTRSLDEDLKRRDFTINAMAYHPHAGLIDLFNGQEDLAAGVVRCVGEPCKRFSEDALRILRALRFASVLGFRTDTKTEIALRTLSPTLSRVSAERIYAELSKLLCGASVSRVLHDYSCVIYEILPEIRSTDAFECLTRVPPTRAARFAALFWSELYDPQMVETALRRLRMDQRTMRDVLTLLSARGMPLATDSDALRLLNRLDDTNLIHDYLSLCNADDELRRRVERLLAEKRCYKVAMLAVNGSDLLAAGVRNGPEIGNILNRLLDAVIDEVCSNDKESLLSYVATIKKPVQ